MDSLLVLTGFETAGDFVELLTGGVGAAAQDAAVDTAAAIVCDVCVAIALALGLDDGPLGGHGAQVLAILAKLWAPNWDSAAARVVARAILRVHAPDLRQSIQRSGPTWEGEAPAELAMPRTGYGWAGTSLARALST